MPKQDPKIYELFHIKLLEDEKVHWVGSSSYDFKRLKGQYNFYIFMAIFLFGLHTIGLVIIEGGLLFLRNLGFLESLIIIPYSIAIFFLFTGIKTSPNGETNTEFVGFIKSFDFHWWKTSYYAITNYRLMIFELGKNRDYWYIELDEPLINQEIDGKKDINFYSKKKANMLYTLNIEIDEAENVYPILLEAWKANLEEESKQKVLDKKEAKIEKLFKPYLVAEEEIIWLGEPLQNRWHLRFSHIAPLFLLCVDLMAYLITKSVYLIAISAIALFYIFILELLSIGIMLILTGLFDGNFIKGIFLILITFAAIYSIGIVGLKYIVRQTWDIPNIRHYSKFLKLTYYAISNQRILIFKQGEVDSYSLILLADAILGKPKRGASPIYLYDKTNPTGEMPEPIGTLSGIEENEAENAYNLLRQAREEAFEIRTRQMGIE